MRSHALTIFDHNLRDNVSLDSLGLCTRLISGALVSHIGALLSVSRGAGGATIGNMAYR